MKKIEFQDYPSTETPLNAENLNQMQDNIENAIVPNIMRVALNNTVQYMPSSDADVVFNNLLQNLGDKLTFENGSIKIGKGVNHIKASCNLWVEAMGESYSLVQLRRIRQGSPYTIGRAMFPKRTGIVDTWVSQAIPESIIDVQEGDIIQCHLYFSVPNQYNCVSGTYLNGSTMQVEVVD